MFGPIGGEVYGLGTANGAHEVTWHAIRTDYGNITNIPDVAHSPLFLFWSMASIVQPHGEKLILKRERLAVTAMMGHSNFRSCRVVAALRRKLAHTPVQRIDGVARSRDTRVKIRRWWLWALVSICITAPACTNDLLIPEKTSLHSPSEFGLWHEEKTFRTADGNRLKAWFMPARGYALGTILFFQRAKGNMSRNLPAAAWFPKAGYNVITFDYRGYGDSPGEADLLRAAQDGAAALRFTRSFKQIDKDKIIVYGRGVGGAVAISALRMAGTQGVRLLIVEDSFASYRELARLKLNERKLTWAFQYPVAYLMFSSEQGPVQTMRGLTPPPFLIVHAENNVPVPLEAGRQLFAAYPLADKEFWIVPDEHHLQTFKYAGLWRNKLLAAIQARLPPDPSTVVKDRVRFDRWR